MSLASDMSTETNTTTTVVECQGEWTVYDTQRERTHARAGGVLLYIDPMDRRACRKSLAYLKILSFYVYE